MTMTTTTMSLGSSHAPIDQRIRIVMADDDRNDLPESE